MELISSILPFGSAPRKPNEFFEKWISGNSNHGEQLLGSADIQSLADLDGSYSIAREMRAVPFRLHDIGTLILIAAIPFTPLLLTVMSVENIAEWLFNTLF